MKSIYVPAVILLSITLALGSTLGHAAGKTAKGAVPQANMIAKKWNADAVLAGASTLDAKADGTAPTWSFSFHSPKTKKGYIVDIRGSKSDALEVRAFATDPIGDFIDSDKAMASAKKNGLKTKKHVPMAVRVLGSGKDARAYWTVGTAFGAGEVAVVLDAKTGALFTTHEGK